MLEAVNFLKKHLQYEYNKYINNYAVNKTANWQFCNLI